MKLSFPRIVFYIGVSLIILGGILLFIEYNENYVKIFLIGVLCSLTGFILYIIREFRKSDKDYKIGMMEK